MQRLVTYAAAAPTAERLRLNNLSPQEGSRKKEKRKGRGYGSGQVKLVLAGCYLVLPHSLKLATCGPVSLTSLITLLRVTLQGGSCGFGMRGQKSRSGSGTRPGFEGGQTSLYRRLPKLKGIAGGKTEPLCKHQHEHGGCSRRDAQV